MKEKLDWSRLDESSFQELCNDLLAQEIRDPRFIPYAPGGKEPFDAEFEGSYGSLDGRWGFDAKFRSPQPGKKNVRSLKKELIGSKERRGLLVKAEEHQRNIVVLLTNVPVRGSDRMTLERLAAGRPVRLLIWDEERIRSLLATHPYIRLYHFQGPGFPMFLPPRHHLALDDDRFISHLTPLHGREREVEAYRAFLASGQRILTVYAAPGMGKSRLLLEFARLTDPRWIPLFLQPEGKVLEDHLAELCPGRRYVVFLDDTQRHVARLGEILALLKASGYYAGLKLVLASRSGFQSQVDSKLAYQDPVDLAEPIALQPLDRETLENLLRWQLPEAPTPTIEALAAIAGGSPLLALAGAKLLRHGEPLQKLLRPGVLQSSFFEAPLREFLSERSGPPDEINKLRELLLHFAVLSPVDERDSLKLQIVSEWMGIPVEHILKLSKEIRDAGFLQRIGRKLKVVPDLLGDYLISSACFDSDGRVRPEERERVQRWFELAPEETLINCADLSFWFPDSGENLVAEIFDQLHSQAIGGSGWERRRLLDLIRPVAPRFPQEALDLISAMLSHPLVPEADAEVGGKIGPVLVRVAYTIEFVEPAMELLRRLIRESPVKTLYGNHQPAEVLAEVVGFSDRKPLAFNRRAIEVLERWWREDASTEGRLLTLSSAAVLLREAIRIWRGTPTSMTISSAPVSTHPAVRALRKRVLALIEQGLTFPELEVRVGTYRELREWLGHMYAPPLPPEALAETSKMVEEECLSLLPLLETQVVQESDLPALAELEDLLWTWWLRGDGEVPAKAGQLLVRLPRSEEFIRYRRLVHVSYLEDLNPEDAAKAATLAERNEVSSQAIDREGKIGANYVEQLAQNVQTVFPSPDHLLDYLDNVFTLRPRGSHERIWRLLHGIAHYPGYAKSLLRIPDFPNRAVHQFTIPLLRGLKAGDPQRFSEFVRELTRDTDAVPAKKLEAIVLGHAYGDPHEDDLAFFWAAATRPEIPVRKAVAQCLRWYLERFRLQVFDLLLTLARPPVSPDFAEAICDVLSGPGGVSLHSADLEWAKQLLDKFVETSEFGPHEYHTKKLQTYVAQLDPHWYLGWIDRRFAHEGAREEGRCFEAVPSSGLREIVAGWENRSDYPDLLRRVRDYCRSRDSRAYEGRRLFAAIAQPYASGDILDEAVAGGNSSGLSKAVGEVLQEWLASSDPVLLGDAADLIGQLPRNKGAYALMVDALVAADQVGMPVLQDVESGLSSAFLSIGYSRGIGKPSEAHLSIVNELDGLLKGPLPRVARRFFERMKEWALSEIERHRIEDEELLGGVR